MTAPSQLPGQPLVPVSQAPRAMSLMHRLRGQLLRLLQGLCAAASIVMIAVGVDPVLSVLPAIYPMATLLVRSFRRMGKSLPSNVIDRQHGIRILLGLLPFSVVAASPSATPWSWVGSTLLALLPLTEPITARVSSGRRLRLANFPDVADYVAPRFPVGVVLTTNLVAIALGTVVALFQLPAILLVIVAVLASVVLSICVIEAFLRVRSSLRSDFQLSQAVDAYQPRFVLYYGVPTGSEYQVQMWMQYLERIGERFIVVLRHRSTFSKISQMTSAPIVVRTSMRQLDDIIVPTLTTCFYVNNGALNTHMVRYPHLTHVQLLHGDSDKATSFNPVTAMFDRIFVAGQAAIDRYAANGIVIPASKFEIVGRPQVENVQQQGPANVPVRTVLYAPTWEGHYADTNYGSLPVGPQVISELLRREVTVIFRPHPYSYRNPEARERISEIHQLLEGDQQTSGREHRWGPAAETDLDVFGCFNLSDAMISDVSSVVPDFLYSAKPYALISMSFTVEEFTQEFPLAVSAYVIHGTLANLDSELDELLVTDSKAAQRRKARTHYLGPFPADGYADAFVDAARAVVLQPKSSHATRLAAS